MTPAMERQKDGKGVEGEKVGDGVDKSNTNSNAMEKNKGTGTGSQTNGELPTGTESQLNGQEVKVESGRQFLKASRKVSPSEIIPSVSKKNKAAAQGSSNDYVKDVIS